MEALGEACQGNQSLFVIKVPDRDVLGVGSPIDSVYFKGRKKMGYQDEEKPEERFSSSLVVKGCLEEN